MIIRFIFIHTLLSIYKIKVYINSTLLYTAAIECLPEFKGKTTKLGKNIKFASDDKSKVAKSCLLLINVKYIKTY